MQQYSCPSPLQGGARGGQRVLHDFREMVLVCVHGDIDRASFLATNSLVSK